MKFYNYFQILINYSLLQSEIFDQILVDLDHWFAVCSFCLLSLKLHFGDLWISLVGVVGCLLSVFYLVPSAFLCLIINTARAFIPGSLLCEPHRFLTKSILKLKIYSLLKWLLLSASTWCVLICELVSKSSPRL